ncbi:acyltransferase domain-containing protein [Cohnella hongkongensis]|uniref:Acyltransferase domain-containing protein n=1 Tax=Cohnella hongkongensis TaxID=178337 RepID=A0ABV9F640_9BACL
MTEPRPDFHQCVAYCRFDHLPEGLEEKYASFEADGETALIPRDFLEELLKRYELPAAVREQMEEALKEIEQDRILFRFTRFLSSAMTVARNRCDPVFYNAMTPGCMKRHGAWYSFLLLLSCIGPAMKLLERRGVPASRYEDVPHQPLKTQLEKIVSSGDPGVHDFPWVMNFYTCSIFLFDRFLFIPHGFDSAFSMYRSSVTNRVVALRHAGETFRSDGQPDGMNGVFDEESRFESVWEEDDAGITANRINPLGFVERETTRIDKKVWAPALRKGDWLLALHIPSGPGYTPERLKTSMEMAIDFYDRYFPEMPIKGFWSESWLYDTRLSLVLDPERSRIVQVQRQLYNYPVGDGDGMLRYELFGDRSADPLQDGRPLKTSLQKAAADYMKTGARFNTLGMIVLKEDVPAIGSMPYITSKDIDLFRATVDSHLRGRVANG